jgi:hypothetical protein
MKPSNLSGKLTGLHFLGYKIVSVTKAIMGFGIAICRFWLAENLQISLTEVQQLTFENRRKPA